MIDMTYADILAYFKEITAGGEWHFEFGIDPQDYYFDFVDFFIPPHTPHTLLFTYCITTQDMFFSDYVKDYFIEVKNEPIGSYSREVAQAMTEIFGIEVNYGDDENRYF